MDKRPLPPAWLRYAEFFPLVLYFIIKYAVIGPESLSGWRGVALIAAAFLANFAIRKYRKEQYAAPEDQD